MGFGFIKINKIIQINDFVKYLFILWIFKNFEKQIVKSVKKLINKYKFYQHIKFL